MQIGLQELEPALLRLVGPQRVIEPQRERRSPGFRSGLHFQNSEENSQGKRSGRGNDPAPVGSTTGFGMRPLRETELLLRFTALLRRLHGAALEWLPDSVARQRVFADNAERFYGL